MLVQLLLKYLSRLQFTAIHNLQQPVCVIHLSACPNAFPLFLKIKSNHGRFRTRLFNCHFYMLLTNGNILILALIPQDWKYNFMITSLLEPCLIIPNYAARHLVHSVSPTMLPEQQLARCSVCVQSPWYHRWACSPILAGYYAGTYAAVLIIQHGIVQEGVYSVSLAPAFTSNLLRSLPKHAACRFQALHVANAHTHRDHFHFLLRYMHNPKEE